MAKGRNGLSYKPKYKVYTALLSQLGENPPVAIELDNGLGEITFTYDGEGQYSVVSNSLFTLDKTSIIMGFGSNQYITVQYYHSSANTISIITYDNQTTQIINNGLSKTAIEIKVYK